ncbi:MAG TPA: protein-glutamate O-methyltransferase CheR [Verrucomicrobiae bacterium]|jgi:chemotaxis protein methyltransferase CheR|nr:protein-glutamate O-methyltransferase CheR [Verrucomicrobiae bacterium]
MQLCSDSIGSRIAPRDYDFICQLVYDHSRIKLGADKRELVTSRLAKRLRALHLDDYSAYCNFLRSPAGADELRELIDRISTNHTHFFREMKHFDFLRETVLPAWKARGAARPACFRVWSAASSSGEEPYSLAIFLSEYLAPPTSGQWQIEGSDISTRILEKAAAGIYESQRVESMPRAWLQRCFQRGHGNWEGNYRIKAEWRARVRFHHLNLLQSEYPFTELFEVIFCRNVMIYFDRATQEDLVRRLARRLAPGGYLMVGHSESLSGIRHELRGVKPAIYQKPA